MRRTLFPIALLSLSLFLTGCADGKIVLIPVSGDPVTVRAEIADSPEERERGLMGRTSLKDNEGMLFVFPAATQMNFWMKNTPIPLEILYFDAEGGFVNALTMEPCTSDPCAVYRSAALAQYALEVVPGFRERHGIGVGAKIDLRSVQRNANPR